MKTTTKITIKKAMNKIQEAIELLEKIQGENEEIDECADALGFAYADLEYEVTN